MNWPEPVARRSIILHYHLFKNAGTSVDAVLQQNFPGAGWATREFERQGGDNSSLIAGWISETPGATAFSTHTGLGPLPRLPEVEVFSVMFLRDPIGRIKSAYRFERHQQTDTLGAQLAKETDFEGYVRARLAKPGDHQCRDFQTRRLASMVPGDAPMIERARQAIRQISLVGSVARFNASMRRLETILQPSFPTFRFSPVQLNTSGGEKATTDTISDELLDLLLANNQNDLQLFAEVDARYNYSPDEGMHSAS